MDNMKLNYFTDDESFPFFIQYGKHSETMFMHGHEDFFELVIVIDGSAEHIVGNERFNIKKGDVFVMKSGLVHGYENPVNFRICNIMFRPEKLLNADYDVKKIPGFHALFFLDSQIGDIQGFISRLYISADKFSYVEILINTAVDEYYSDNSGKNTMVTALMLQLIVYLSRLYDTPEKKHEISGIAEAAAYIEQHYSEEININKILEISHYSYRHFIRLFSETYNITPQKYLMNIRIRHACLLLHEENLSITDISSKCGFGDSNYFSRAFRKNVGLTPTAYRNTIIKI